MGFHRPEWSYVVRPYLTLLSQVPVSGPNLVVKCPLENLTFKLLQSINGQMHSILHTDRHNYCEYLLRSKTKIFKTYENFGLSLGSVCIGLYIAIKHEKTPVMEDVK